MKNSVGDDEGRFEISFKQLINNIVQRHFQISFNSKDRSMVDIEVDVA